MSNHADAEKLVLHSTKGRTLAFLAMCLVFCAGSVWMIQDGRSIGWFPLVVFAIGSVVFAVNFLPSASKLVLTREGFTFTSLFREQKVTPWSHVAHFGIAHVSLNRMLGWDYVPEHRPAGKAPGLSKAASGFEAALPDSYGMKMQDLVSLMEDWRNRYGARGG
jgi:hypothetical protein